MAVLTTWKNVEHTHGPGSSPTYRAGPFAFSLSVQKELRFFACWCMFGDSKIKGRTEGGDDACMRKIIQGPGQAASSLSSSSGRHAPLTLTSSGRAVIVRAAGLGNQQ